MRLSIRNRNNGRPPCEIFRWKRAHSILRRPASRATIYWAILSPAEPQKSIIIAAMHFGNFSRFKAFVRQSDPISGFPPIGVGAQSTLGGAEHFWPKIYVWKITKWTNFTWYLPEKLEKCPDCYTIFARKIYSRFLLWGGGSRLLCPPPVSYASMFPPYDMRWNFNSVR